MPHTHHTDIIILQHVCEFPIVAIAIESYSSTIFWLEINSSVVVC